MGDPYVQLWDGTNKASVSNGALNVNAEITAEIVGASIIATLPAGVSVVGWNSGTLGTTTIIVGLTAIQLTESVPSRTSLLLENKGTTTIWISGASNVQSGASGFNFTVLTAGQRVNIERYNGVLWGIGSGISGSIAPLGVASIG